MFGMKAGSFDLIGKALKAMNVDPLKMADGIIPQAWQKLAELEAEAGAALFAVIAADKATGYFQLSLYKDSETGGDLWRSFPFRTFSELINHFAPDAAKAYNSPEPEAAVYQLAPGAEPGANEPAQGAAAIPAACL